MKYKCVTDGFKTRGYKINNPDSEKWVSVVNGDVLECDESVSLKTEFHCAIKIAFLENIISERLMNEYVRICKWNI